MGDERASISQSLFTPVWINFYLHFKPIVEKRGEKEIMIPLEILDMNSLIAEPLETSEHRKIIWKRKRLLEV